MPTPTGLPKRGEVWERVLTLPPDWEPQVTRFLVLERSRGDYWSLRVQLVGGERQLWVDPAYWLSKGWLRYVKAAPPDVMERIKG